MAIKVKAPPSKSYTLRALFLSMLADGPTRIINPLNADDPRVLLGCIRSLGAEVQEDEGEWRIAPPREIVAPRDPIYVGNSGASLRFLMPVSLVAKGPLWLDGDDNLRNRPSHGLLASLRSLGVGVEERGKPACPPLVLHPPSGPIPSGVFLDPAGSGQQVSALLLIAPKLERGLTVRLTLEPPSRPYIDMSIDALSKFGVAVEKIEPLTYHVPRSHMVCERFEVEGDHSAAAFLWAAGWVLGKEIVVENLNERSLQGDRVFPMLLGDLAKGRSTFDMRDVPDLVPPLAACALFVDHPTEFRSISHLRIKETDRISALALGLRALGAVVESGGDFMKIVPTKSYRSAVLDPHGDHRIAMAFGVVALRVRGITITDRGCVSKSFPEFWTWLEKIEKS